MGLQQYGNWALIAGASQGIGRAFAHKAASEGLNCILVSRSEAPLQELAAELRSAHGVECLVIAADLSAADAVQTVVQGIGDREVGLLIHNAGADPNGSRFLELALDKWIALANLNVSTTLGLCHHFGAEMKARGRGGIVIVGSGACYGGSLFTSVYSGAKAFEMCFAEGFWSEMKPHGVDVLFCALGATDTPAFRDLLQRKGSVVPQGLAAPEDVAAKVLDHLPRGPVFNWGHGDDDSGHLPMSAASRRQRVLMIDQASKRIFGE